MTKQELLEENAILRNKISILELMEEDLRDNFVKLVGLKSDDFTGNIQKYTWYDVACEVGKLVKLRMQEDERSEIDSLRRQIRSCIEELDKQK